MSQPYFARGRKLYERMWRIFTGMIVEVPFFSPSSIKALITETSPVLVGTRLISQCRIIPNSLFAVFVFGFGAFVVRMGSARLLTRQVLIRLINYDA